MWPDHSPGSWVGTMPLSLFFHLTNGNTAYQGLSQESAGGQKGSGHCRAPHGKRPLQLWEGEVGQRRRQSSQSAGGSLPSGERWAGLGQSRQEDMQIHSYTHTHTHTHTRTHTHARTHACMHTCMHTAQKPRHQTMQGRDRRERATGLGRLEHHGLRGGAPIYLKAAFVPNCLEQAGSWYY
jgi:hypothetical protein